MTTPLQTRIVPRPRVQRESSPLTMVLVTPKIEIATANITIGAADNELSEVTDATVDALLGAGFARAAYNYIESGSSVRLFVLPFAVDTTDNDPAERLGRVVAALTAMEGEAQKSKLPNRTFDVLALPRESGLGTTAGNIAFTKVKETCTAFRAQAIVDAGPIAPTGDLADTPSDADVATWIGANKDPNILSVTNRGDASNIAGMGGSVIAAGHWATYTSLYGIHAQPTNLRDVVQGVTNIDPVRGFDLLDGSAPAIVLANDPNYASSLITWNGQHYLWGGKTSFPANDARQYFGNNLVANRMVKEAQRDIAPYIGLTSRTRTLESMQIHVQNDLEATYVPGAVASVIARDPVISGNHVSLGLSVQFYDFIESVELVVDVYV